MDENQTQAVTEETTEKKDDMIEKKEETAEKNAQISFSVLSILLAFISVALIAFFRIILYFGPSNPSVIRGIFSIFIYGTALASVVISYLKNKKPSFEFWLCVGALVATLWFF